MDEMHVNISICNDTLQVFFITDKYIVKIYTDVDNKGMLYIGPYNKGQILLSDPYYYNKVRDFEYMNYIGVLFKNVLISMCDITVDDTQTMNIHTPRDISSELRAKGKYNDSWQWLELVNDNCIMYRNAVAIYNYFKTKPLSIETLQYCITWEVVVPIFTHIDTFIESVTYPNTKAMLILNEIIKTPCTISCLQGV